MSWRWLCHLTVSCVQSIFARSNILVALSVAEEILMMESSLERSSHTYHKMYWYYCSVFVNLHDVIERYFGRQHSYSHFLLLILDQHAVTHFNIFWRSVIKVFNLFWATGFSLFLYWDFILKVILFITFSSSTIFFYQA